MSTRGSVHSSAAPQLEGGTGSNSEPIPLKYQRRRTKLRPVFPRVDWMIMPNLLAYVMSWYGLLIGKFPVQMMCIMLGMGFMFAAGMSRITIVELKSEDFLPTNSPSTEERSKTILFDFSEKEDPSEYVTVIRPLPPTFKPGTLRTTVNPVVLNSTVPRPVKREPSVATRKPQNGMEMSTPAPTYLTRQKRDLLGPDGTSQNCRVSSMLIVAKRNVSDPDGKSYNLYDKAMLKEIEILENLIYDMEVSVETTGGYRGSYHYEDKGVPKSGVCTKQPTGECGGFTLRVMRSLFKNSDGTDPIPLIFSKLPGVGLTWPHYLSYDLSSFFGRVLTVGDKANGMVRHIGAMREVFCVNEYFSDYLMRQIRVWELWEKKFDETMRKYNSKYFDVYWMSEYQKQAEQNTLVLVMMPKLICTFAALMMWCAAGAMMGDAVQAKPWAGFIGVFSTLMACAAGFGIQLWTDPKFQVILMAVPLLTLAIGLDDMFILLEAWSATNPKLPVEERMMLSMNTGGTSIVITFFINLLDFVVGNLTPFPVINMLSEYAIATMVLDFFFQMTVFAPCVVLLGRDEENNRHSCCKCVKVPSRESVLESKNGCYLVCCAGGFADEIKQKDAPKEVEREEEDKSAAVQLVVRVLASQPFRIIALFLFAGYIGASVWSLQQMEVGLKAERVYRASSNLYAYFQNHRVLFTGYGKEIKVFIMNEVDYASPVVRRKILDMTEKVEESGYFWADTETEVWVRDFAQWADDNQVNLTSLRNNTDLLYELRRSPGGFLDSTDPRTYTFYGATDKHGRSIRMSQDGTRIMKSQFRFRARDMSGPDRQIGMMSTIRNVLKAYRPEMEMYAYMDEFLLYDQFISAVPTTLYYCSITLAVTIGVAVFMIPHPACLFWVAVFICTVLVGIIGFMRLWDIDLDSVSLINLLIAISFCSDLIAHPIYIFMISPAVDKNGKKLTGYKARVEKAKATVEEVTQAAIPACVGTTLSVISMSTSDAYIFITFFRIMFLSVVLSIAHGLIFVPAFLSFVGPSDSRLQIAIKAGEKGEEGSKTEDTLGTPSSSATRSEHDYETVNNSVINGVEETSQVYSRYLSQRVRDRSSSSERAHSQNRHVARLRPPSPGSSSTSSSAVPFVSRRPLSRLFHGMRGGLGALNEVVLRPRPSVDPNPDGQNDANRRRDTHQLPPTIRRVKTNSTINGSTARVRPSVTAENGVPRVSSRRLTTEEIREELRSQSLERQKERDRQELQRRLAKHRAPVVVAPQTQPRKRQDQSPVVDRRKFLPREAGVMSERVRRRWGPPFKTPASQTTNRLPQLPPMIPESSTSGTGLQSLTTTAAVLTSRSGALMLPARHRFNM